MRKGLNKVVILKEDPSSFYFSVNKNVYYRMRWHNKLIRLNDDLRIILNVKLSEGNIITHRTIVGSPVHIDPGMNIKIAIVENVRICKLTVQQKLGNGNR